MTKHSETVLALLPFLSNEELLEVEKRVKALNALPASPRSKPENDGDILELIMLEVMFNFFASIGVECPPPTSLRRGSAYPAYKEKIGQLQRYIKQARLNRVQLRAFLLLAVELLYQSVLKTMPGVPVGARVMMMNIHRIPEVIEQHFPGYAASGLLPAIVRRSSK